MWYYKKRSKIKCVDSRCIKANRRVLLEEELGMIERCNDILETFCESKALINKILIGEEYEFKTYGIYKSNISHSSPPQ